MGNVIKLPTAASPTDDKLSNYLWALLPSRRMAANGVEPVSEEQLVVDMVSDGHMSVAAAKATIKALKAQALLVETILTIIDRNHPEPHRFDFFGGYSWVATGEGEHVATVLTVAPKGQSEYLRVACNTYTFPTHPAKLPERPETSLELIAENVPKGYDVLAGLFRVLGDYSRSRSIDGTSLQFYLTASEWSDPVFCLNSITITPPSEWFKLTASASTAAPAVREQQDQFRDNRIRKLLGEYNESKIIEYFYQITCDEPITTADPVDNVVSFTQGK